MNNDLKKKVIEMYNELGKLIEALLNENDELQKDVDETVVVVNYPKKS